jgi:hypothetical protein
MVASRVRRRYRLTKGGHPFLVLVHYSRGQSVCQSPFLHVNNVHISLTPSPSPRLELSAIPPALQAQPVRQYPLRQHNEPAVFVLGERQGQRVPPAGPVGGMPPNLGVGAGVGVGVGGRPDAQAMLVQQNREMEALERRNQRERSASMNPVPVRHVPAICPATSFDVLMACYPAFLSRGNRSLRNGSTRKTRRMS